MIDHPLLSERENEVMRLVCAGFTDDEIAVRLEPPITRDGVQAHLRRIYPKLDVPSRRGASSAYSRWIGRQEGAAMGPVHAKPRRREAASQPLELR